MTNNSYCITEEGEEDIVGEEDVTEAKERPIYVCRANYDGIWVSGELRTEQKGCVVSLQGIRRKYDHYQVLENVENGARLSWVRWNKMNVVIPMGTVSCAQAETFVARHRVEESNGADEDLPEVNYHIGRLDTKDGFGKISIVNRVSTVYNTLTVKVIIKQI